MGGKDCCSIVEDPGCTKLFDCLHEHIEIVVTGSDHIYGPLSKSCIQDGDIHPVAAEKIDRKRKWIRRIQSVEDYFTRSLKHIVETQVLHDHVLGFIEAVVSMHRGNRCITNLIGPLGLEDVKPDICPHIPNREPAGAPIKGVGVCELQRLDCTVASVYLQLIGQRGGKGQDLERSEMIPMLVGDEQVLDRLSGNTKDLQLLTVVTVDQDIRKNNGLSGTTQIPSAEFSNSRKIPEIILQIIYPGEAGEPSFGIRPIYLDAFGMILATNKPVAFLETSAMVTFF